MKKLLASEIKKWAIYGRALGKWLFTAVLTGLLCGLLGTAFHIGVEKVTLLREANPWLLYTLPLLGLAIVGVYRLTRSENLSTNTILEQVHSGKGLKLSLVPAIFVSTVLTHLGGGSAGREGAALQMGGTIGYSVGKLLRFDDRDLRLATMTGMAAFFSALFGTPLTAAVFSMAVISVGLVYNAALFPCLTAALAASGVSMLLGVEPTHFAVTVPAMSWLMLLRVGVLTALCAMVSILFCHAIHGMEHWGKKSIPNPWLRAAAGGVLVILLTKLCGTGAYNGAGMGVIAAAVERGQAVPAAFLWKILFTAVTLGAGFKGGEVVPSFFVGATFGCVMGPLLGIPAGFAAAVGLISVFCAAVNCPLATIFLSIELFGVEGLLYYAMACALSFILSGYTGLYSSQRILYDKLKARYINVYTNSYHQDQRSETDDGNTP